MKQLPFDLQHCSYYHIAKDNYIENANNINIMLNKHIIRYLKMRLTEKTASESENVKSRGRERNR